MTGITVTSIYGAHTRRGLVQVTLTDESDQQTTIIMMPIEARSVAHSIEEAAVAAESDEIMMRFLMKTGGMPAEQAAAILGEFRKYRAEMESAQP